MDFNNKGYNASKEGQVEGQGWAGYGLAVGKKKK
jgi:hypothetical protein